MFLLEKNHNSLFYSQFFFSVSFVSIFILKKNNHPNINQNTV